MSTKIKGGSNTAGEANVNANFQLSVTTETNASSNPNYVGAVKSFSEVDSGEYLGGNIDLRSTETDDDYRQRVAHDNLMDYDFFNVATQNTGKHTFVNTTLGATMTTAGLTTNSGQVNTTNIGLTFGTHAQFPIYPTQTIVCEVSVAFTAQPTANAIVDFGMFQRGATTAFAPLDGFYFRLNSDGLRGVINSNGAEIQTEAFNFTYVENKNYRFLIQATNVRTTFWVSNGSSIDKLGQIITPEGLKYPCLSQSLPFSLRHANVGTTGDATFRCVFGDYKVLNRGSQFADNLGVVQNRILGTYQGLTGGTMGQLVAGTVTTGTLVKPTAAIPSNTVLTANLPNSLGGRIYEQLASGLASNVDGIYASYQVPIGSATVQGKRLKVVGLKLSGFVQTVAVSTAIQTEWYIAFGHTAVSLQTPETGSMASPTTKAPRRVMLPELTTLLTANQAANTRLDQPSYYADFSNAPIYVNAGEFIALVGNKTGTTPTSGVLAYSYQFIYTWE